MTAKNGWMQSFRLLGCLMAVAMLASALFASVASAKKAEPTNPTAYINMGDSVSFGYTNEKFVLNFPAEPPSAFEGGYPNLAFAKLVKKEAKLNNKLSLINLACPGEASKGLIGNGPLAEALIAKSGETHFTEGEAPCGWHNVNGFEQHFPFGSVSQLEAASGLVVAGLKEEGPKITNVTLQIGSNDELHKLGECNNEAYRSAHGWTSFIECISQEATKTLFPSIINNLGLDVKVLREAGYTGPVAILGFYNPQALLPGGSGTDPLQKGLNEALEATIKGGGFGTGVAYANPFKKTNPQGKKTETPEQKQAHEREAICLYTEECNVFDKKLNLEKEKGKAYSEEEVLAIEAAAKTMLPGDIHPTKAGDELFAKLVGAALKKA